MAYIYTGSNKEVGAFITTNANRDLKIFVCECSHGIIVRLNLGRSYAIIYHVSIFILNTLLMRINNLDFDELKDLDVNRLEYYSSSENYRFNFLYILYKNNVVVYVGQSMDHPNQRISAHLSSSKSFDRFSIIKLNGEYNKMALNGAEALLILKFKPIYNCSIPPNKLYVRRNKLTNAVGIHHKTLKRLMKSINIKHYTTEFLDYNYIDVEALKKAIGL